MDIKQEIKNTQRELENTVAKANELQDESQAKLQQRQLVLQEAFKIEGELRLLRKMQGEKGAKQTHE